MGVIEGSGEDGEDERDGWGVLTSDGGWWIDEHEIRNEDWMYDDDDDDDDDDELYGWDLTWPVVPLTMFSYLVL